MKNKPLVSVLIASYNKERYVKRSILSCLKQNYNNVEIIFVDDDSEDKSFSTAKKFKKVKVFKKKNNFKLKRKFNTYFQIQTYLHAFKKSNGKFIFFLDSDDFFKKDKIKKMMNFFIKNSDNQILFDKPIVYYSDQNFYSDNNFYKRRNLWPKFPPQSCIAIRRSFFKKVLPEISKKHFHLLTLDFRLAAISHFIYDNFEIFNENLTYYFQDPKGESHNKFKKFNYNWWLRRKQAHEYCRYINLKYNNKYNLSIDNLITNIIVSLLKLFR